MSKNILACSGPIPGSSIKTSPFCGEVKTMKRNQRLKGNYNSPLAAVSILTFGQVAGIVGSIPSWGIYRRRRR
jgi:hypothetical protein